MRAITRIAPAGHSRVWWGVLFRLFEAKYHMPFDAFQSKNENLSGEEVFTEEDDYMDWRFAKEAMDKLKKQKQELEYA